MLFDFQAILHSEIVFINKNYIKILKNPKFVMSINSLKRIKYSKNLIIYYI